MKILSRPKGDAQEYGRWSVNPFVGCPHGCRYCYLKKGVWSERLGGLAPLLKEHIINEDHAYHIAMAEIIENREQIIKDGGLFMTFTSDPMCPQCRELFMRIIHDCLHYDVPIMVLTKSVGFCTTPAYHTLLQEGRQAGVAFGWTLTGHDEMEPNAPTHRERLRNMGIVYNGGFKVWASIEPVIDFHSSYNMILCALDAGCFHFKIGLLTTNTKVCRKNYGRKECIAFIHDVMRVVNSRGATVYWKKSVRTFLGEEDYARAIVGYAGTVEYDWNIFNGK